ncbi:L-tyrosine decarboxylase [Methanocella paludicola SANAE]|uniref:Probable L-tyrosine/L-aspartate decarboxylase n=1 Tax=Methanocella paludicola (strain DSM 17711 / JCM 13418 / NBRC 101707 / SANAE) TaxID=304371 RepID=D1YVJ9_METPS|nr:tyrosine decarboxylase MfnA [Methanocella paludicola]BAI60471.1 L-tyrosine decarboxylase [Methanocella paludicola SANAE]
MREHGVDEDTIIRELKGACARNVPYERVLSSMCTTPHPIAIKAHKEFIVSNLGDPRLFPGTASLEHACIGMLGELLHLPSAVGYITTGGTESNIQALRTARQLKHVDPGKANIVLPESAHYSFDKAAQMLGVSLRRTPLDDEMKADMDAMAGLVDKNTIALVAVAGTTEFGQVDPIPAISKLALDENIFLHVDAAFGGFVIPFMKDPSKYRFDFELPGVMSIAIDPHKMGMSTIPSGGLLYRDERHMKSLEISAQYLTSQVQSSLAGTRTGASAAATYAVMRHLGMDGYRRVVSECMDNTMFLRDSLVDMDIELALEPIMNIVTAKLPDAQSTRKKLCDMGWFVSTTSRPEALRMVVMPHVTRDVIEAFMADLKKIS